MTLQAVQAIEPTLIAAPTPWVGGQLPSAWSAPGGQQVPPASLNSFTQSLEQARSAVMPMGSSLPIVSTNQVGPSNPGGPSALSGLNGQANLHGIHPVAQSASDGGIGKKIGLSAIETMGSRLSAADAKMFKSVESLNNLDITAPNIHAEFLSISLMSAKAGISTNLAMKFSSKINESINTLLKSS